MTHVTPMFDNRSGSGPILDMADSPQPAPLMTSRGVRLGVFAASPVMLAIVLAEIAVFVRILRSQIDLEKGIGLMFGGILVGAVMVLPMYLKLVEGWTRQDVAKTEASAPKAPQVQVATGDGASATTTNVTDVHTTPAETPVAKQNSASQ